MKTAAKGIIFSLWLVIAAFELLLSGPAASAKSPLGLQNCTWKIFSLAAQTSQPNPSQVTQPQQERAPPQVKEASDDVLAPETNSGSDVSSVAPSQNTTLDLSASDSWGNLTKLQEHLEDHGADFGATSPEEYAKMASDFLQQSQTMGLPTKIDPTTGVIRVYDPETNTFGAFNPDGTTRTFFKPTSPTYFDRQPGQASSTPQQ